MQHKEDTQCAMNAKLTRLAARGKSLSARMACLDEGNAKIKSFIALTKEKNTRMEELSLVAEKSLQVLVDVLDRKKKKEGDA